MKNVAPNVYRWTERMNNVGMADGEFHDRPETWLPDDGIPATLEPVLRLMFQDWGPELLANASLYNDWVAANPGLPTGHLVSAGGERVMAIRLARKMVRQNYVLVLAQVGGDP